MVSTLLILAQHGYQDFEYATTRKQLESTKFLITVASAKAGLCQGSLGGQEKATLAIKDVDTVSFDAILFIGGPGASSFFTDPEAHRIAREALRQGKILGAICIAPVILARAGVLKGKRATVWDSGGEQERILTDAGALCTGEAVTVDGKVVTGNGPQAAEEFGRVIAGLT
jgi:protease I